MLLQAFRVLVTLAALVGTALAAQPLTDDEVKERIIGASGASYKFAGNLCACPYDVALSGLRCGRRSAYSGHGQAAPLCYPTDISSEMVAGWRRLHVVQSANQGDNH